MKRFLPAFGAPLILAASLSLSDAPLPTALLSSSGYGHQSLLDPLPGTLAQSATSQAQAPNLRSKPLPKLTLPYVQPPQTLRDAIPRTYMVYGLRTGPNGMGCTDRNGAVISIPFNPQITLGPRTARPTFPQTLPPTFTLPRLTPLPAPIAP